MTVNATLGLPESIAIEKIAKATGVDAPRLVALAVTDFAARCFDDLGKLDVDAERLREEVSLAQFGVLGRQREILGRATLEQAVIDTYLA